MEVLLGKKFNRVHFTGPLSNYNEYCKSLSNILGIEVGANKYDASSFGNAINQFIYLKRFENHVRSSEFLRLNFQEKIYIPEESEKVECESAYKRYLMLKKTR